MATNYIERYENQQKKHWEKEHNRTMNFNTGDTISVGVNIKEGNRNRVQTFTGHVIAINNQGLRTTFTVRKISSGIGVERTFDLYSKLVNEIKVERQGRVRQSKIYYQRGLTGKKARIKEKL